MIVLSLGLSQRSSGLESQKPRADGRWAGSTPSHCYVAGWDSELGTNWFAGNDCTVPRVRQGDE